MADAITIQMQNILDSYSEEVKQTARKETKAVAREAATKLRGASPKKTGKYASGWASKQIRADTFVVYNRKAPGLTHLLENGHIIRNKKGTYGRVGAKKHIAPVADWAENELINKIERDLK